MTEFYIISIFKDNKSHFLSRDPYTHYWNSNLFDPDVCKFASINDAKDRLLQDDFTEEQIMSDGSIRPPRMLDLSKDMSSVEVQISKISINITCERSYTGKVKVKRPELLKPRRITIFD